MSEWDWMLNDTCKDISVIYVTAHRCAGGLKKLDLTRAPTPLTFRRVLQSTDTGLTFLLLFPENDPFLMPLTTRTCMEIQSTYSPRKPPRVPTGSRYWPKFEWKYKCTNTVDVYVLLPICIFSLPYVLTISLPYVFSPPISKVTNLYLR